MNSNTMKIITDNNALLAIIPNVINAVEGEKTLYDKLNPWLVTTEQWICDTFTGTEIMEQIADDTDTAPWRATAWQQVANVIACEAMRQAIPSLDLVLTPNGFGIVSNQNVAPASKERVERLIGSMTARRDLMIEYLLDSLQQISEWKSTQQCDWFCQTLLQSPRAAVLAVHGRTFDGDQWQEFLTLRDRARPIEAVIAERWVSPELMVRLRTALVTPDATSSEIDLALKVRDCVFAELAGQPRRHAMLDRIVNYVRKRPDTFPEWTNSDTARLFDPPVFRNKKDSSGYFF